MNTLELQPLTEDIAAQQTTYEDIRSMHEVRLRQMGTLDKTLQHLQDGGHKEFDETARVSVAVLKNRSEEGSLEEIPALKVSAVSQNPYGGAQETVRYE